ncbi:YsnF/AvaK domain-containing protein [Paracoccus sp. (in: a-proteobacteria)]|uniref:YsnF/AvaK domain-containing protein n=1 Tax=Paracoccus sp. TaxID=267 RepID=UPI00396C587B
MTYDNETPMSGSANKSVSAMFDNRGDAQRAVDRLQETGISSTQIRMVEGSSSAGTTTGQTSDQEKGFWDSLSDFFFPDEDRYTYAEGLSRGGYLVTVTGLSSAHYETVLDILDDEGTIDLNEREASWRSEGWGGYESSSYATGTVVPGGVRGTTLDTAYTERSDDYGDAGQTGAYEGVGRTGSYDETDRTTAYEADQTTGYGDRTTGMNDESIPVVEERLTVGKRDTSHGRVRVRAYTVETPVSETVELRDERVELERRPVDRAVTGTEAAFQDRTIEAEEYGEEAVVSKEARVVEEIGLRKVSESHQETVSDTVRHTEVEVDDDRTNLDPTRR